jgi:hypothetical protein
VGEPRRPTQPHPGRCAETAARGTGRLEPRQPREAPEALAPRRGHYGLSLRPVLKRYCDHATTISVNAAVTANESHTDTSLVPRKP